jgi:hypothetical protein
MLGGMLIVIVWAFGHGVADEQTRFFTVKLRDVEASASIPFLPSENALIVQVRSEDTLASLIE